MLRACRHISVSARKTASVFDVFFVPLLCMCCVRAYSLANIHTCMLLPLLTAGSLYLQGVWPADIEMHRPRTTVVCICRLTSVVTPHMHAQTTNQDRTQTWISSKGPPHTPIVTVQACNLFVFLLF